jgi:flagellar M-ring protein FliF
MPQRSRRGLVAGAVLAVMAVAWLAFWALRTDYKVLFANLAPQDAATMVAELERAKVAYRLEDGGNTILVPDAVVYQTRLKLIGANLPLHGAVGLELFNNSDVGMTEFAQKVNYQRGQQGELTRTILAIEEVQSARVHLALPEQGLFKKAGAQPKASISIATKPGKTLQANQVAGIQRLVAAAIPSIKAEDVTIVNQHGVALTQAAEAEGDEGSGSGATLDSKRAVEEYLNRKLLAMLDQTFGAGQAIASVDVLLSLDRSKATTESVLPSGRRDGSDLAGVMVREKLTTRPATAAAQAGGNASEETVQSDTEYQVGRKVEQVVSARGGIRRLNVAVVVKAPLTAEQTEHLKQVAALAVGFDKERGDGIAVYPIAQFVQAAADAAPEALPSPVPPAAPPAPPAAAAKLPAGAGVPLAVFALLAAGAGLLYLRARRARQLAAPPLSAAQRTAMLAQMGQWVELQAVPAKEPQA